MKHTLVAAFDNYSDAESVKTQLISKGISQTDIRMAASNSVDEDTSMSSSDSSTTAREDETVGDKISHFFQSLFGDDTEDRRYAQSYPEAVRRGSTVVTVVVDDSVEDEVVELMERNGAIDIDERSAGWTDNGTPTALDDTGTAYTGATTDTAATTGTTGTTDMGTRTGTADQSIPVMEEQLKVGKREKNTGRVRVVSHISERPVEETVSLKEQHATIERNPVDRAASPDELNNLKDSSVEIRETAEEPVVEKSARVVEEVQVGTETTQRDETVRDTVRKTDVDIDRDGTKGRLDDDLSEKKY